MSWVDEHLTHMLRDQRQSGRTSALITTLVAEANLHPERRIIVFFGDQRIADNFAAEFWPRAARVLVTDRRQITFHTVKGRMPLVPGALVLYEHTAVEALLRKALLERDEADREVARLRKLGGVL